MEKDLFSQFIKNQAAINFINRMLTIFSPYFRTKANF